MNEAETRLGTMSFKQLRAMNEAETSLGTMSFKQECVASLIDYCLSSLAYVRLCVTVFDKSMRDETSLVVGIRCGLHLDEISIKH
ncbi:CLUMA_CG018726, isoform A [Clunio marinus]|uniref:CLUMA_CG018726, isoform A n=1 Tax=Clunio marinus TaxID=568069 RepID=A0A1J1J2M1_9DIPT|nr:CLUMA_CG018726, isoform A [Clunio marinus]